MTQLRAAGVPDGSMTLANDGPEGTRADEVGVPDSAAGTGPDDAAQIRLVIELAGLDVEPDEIDRILAAAGGAAILTGR